VSQQYVRLPNVIDPVELLRRWPGVSEDELAAMAKKNTIPAYHQQKRLESPDGQQYSFCTPGAKPWVHREDETVYYDWGNIVFDPADVSRLEKQQPELKWLVPGIESPSKSDQQAKQDDSEWVQCDTLARRWGWSPFDVLGILGPNKGQLRYHHPHSTYPPSSPEGLSDAYVHTVDLVRWEAEKGIRACF
jgi:hypothetical protein